MARKNVSLTRTGPGYEEEQLRHAQNLAVAQEMIKQGLTPRGKGTIDTGKYLVPDFGDAIARIGQAYFGKQMRDEANAGVADVSARKQAEIAEGMNTFNSLRFGPNTGNAPTGSSEGPPEEYDTLPPQIKAISYALANRMPEVQAQGEKLQEGLITQKELYKGMHNYNPATVATSGAPTGVISNPAALSGAPKAMLSDGVVAGVLPTGDIVSKNPVNTFSPSAVNPSTGLPGQIEKVTGKEYTQQGGNLTPERHAQNKFADAGIENAVKELQVGKVEVAKIADQMGLMKQLPQLIAATRTGAGADYKQFAARWAETLGVPVDVNKISDYQSLVNAIGPSMITTLKQFGAGTGISDADMRAAKAMTLTDLVNDPNAMMRAQGLILAANLNKIQRHEGMIAEVSKWEGAAPYVNQFQVPVAWNTELTDMYGLVQNPQSGSWEAPISSQATREGLPGGKPATAAIGQAPDLSKMSDEELRKIISGGR